MIQLYRFAIRAIMQAATIYHDNRGSHKHVIMIHRSGHSASRHSNLDETARLRMQAHLYRVHLVAEAHYRAFPSLAAKGKGEAHPTSSFPLPPLCLPSPCTHSLPLLPPSPPFLMSPTPLPYLPLLLVLLRRLPSLLSHPLLISHLPLSLPCL